MLFFKDLMDEKLNQAGFREFYEKECHICPKTIKVVECLENKKQARFHILDSLHISEKAYEALKEGDCCDPRIVKQLWDYLNFKEVGAFKNCPKLQPGVESEK